MDLAPLSIKKAAQALLNKEFSCKELTSAYLKNIKLQDKKLNAFLRVDREAALLEAENIDQLLAQGKKLSPLAGIPIAVKDNILVKQKKATVGSKILENYLAPYDAFVTKKLKQAGAIIIGKTNLDEFAMGASGEHSAFGPTKNPANLAYVPGGSSSGSAVAVAANMALGAIGSDTAGSVRQPASFCGIVGMKPTYGVVSRYGLIAMASSLDQIGPLAKNVEDAEIIFDIIRGWDKMDSTSLKAVELGEKEIHSLKGLIIGLPKQCFAGGIEKKVLEIAQEKAKKLETAGARIEEVDIPHLGYGVACYYIIMPAEVSSNLARYDGIKYGAISEAGDDLMDVYFNTRAEFFGPEVKRRIMLGTYALSSGYYEAYYLRALKVRTKIKMDFDKAFEKVDFVFTPTAPSLPFKIGEKIDDPLAMYMADLLTVPANLAGLPGISIPAGRVGGLPVGVQFVAPALKDKKLLAVSKLAEKLWTP